MFFENLKKQIRALTPEQLEAHGVLRRSPDGNFICPACGNGEGEDGTGIEFTQTNDGTYVAHCFKCGSDFDIIYILAEYYGLSAKVSFQMILKMAAQEFGLDVDDVQSSRKSNAPINDNFNQASSAEDTKNSSASSKSNEQRDFSPTLDSAAQRMPAYLAERGGVLRGLNAQTLAKFRVGYIPKCGKFGLPRITIPTSNFHYLSRLAVPASELHKFGVPEGENIPEKQHFGQKEVFNLGDLAKAKADDNATFFATEGEFDAMSILQVGFNAIAFSGAGISRHQLDQLATVPEKSRIVILFDNDEAGHLNAPKAVAKLKKVGYNAVAAFLPKSVRKNVDDAGEIQEVIGIKDANELLQINPQILETVLGEILESTQSQFDNGAEQERFDKVNSGEEFVAPLRTSQQLFPNCPVDVVIPEGFFVRQNGMYKLFKTHEPELICDAPCFIAKKHFNQDGEDVRAEITFLDHRNNTWRNFKVKMSDLLDYRTFGKNFCSRGVYMTAKGAARLSAFFAEMLAIPENQERIETKSFFQQTGWLQGEFKEFAFPTDHSGKYPVINGNFDFAAAFAQHGSRKKSLELLKVLLSASTTSRITLGAVMAAPLVRPFGLRNPQLHLCAKSGSGKSAVIKAAMSMFGNPQLLRQTFGNTPRFIDELSAKFNDFPVWIDEFQSLNKIARLNIDDQIYTYENGISRGRLNKDAEEKPQSIFSGVRITSGEQPLTHYASGQGAKNRVLELDFSEILSDKEARFIHRAFTTKNSANFGFFGREFVEWITIPANMQALVDFYDDMVYQLRKRGAIANGYSGDLHADTVNGLPDEIVGIIPAHCQMLALFLTAMYGVTKMAFADEADTVDTVRTLIDIDIENFIKNFTQSQLTTTAERALPAILETKLTHADRFQHLTADGNRVVASVKSPTLGLLLSDGSVGFYPNQFKQLIQELGFNSHTEIISTLSELEVIEEGNSRHHVHQKFVDVTTDSGEQQGRWMYVFRPDAEQILARRKRSIAASFAG